MRTQNQQEQWLVQWYDWFYRVKRYLALDPHITLSEGARAHLIYSVDQDAIAGEVFASQIPPGEGRAATRGIVRKLDALSARLCDGGPGLSLERFVGRSEH
jgi:hypothetical protein